MDWNHSLGETQTRLYIPGNGVLAFRTASNIDFFDDSPEALADAEKYISGRAESDGEVEYLGEVELPDDLVTRVIAFGRQLNSARADFENSAKTLLELIK